MISKIKEAYRRFIEPEWNIALCDTPVEELLAGARPRLRWLRHDCRDRWFADPFILSADDREVHFLVEEFPYSTRRGRIAHLVADRRTMELTSIRAVLELDSHLSFPAILRDGDDIYIYPENGTGRGLVLYKYDPATDSCEEVRQISDRPLADAVICDIGGRGYMLATAIPDHNGHTLEVHAMDGLTPRPLHTFDFGRDIARNAGGIFSAGGRVYRPAQESVTDEYGVAVSLQRVDVGADGRLSFTEEACFGSPSPRYDLGFHTFNVYGDLIVVDAKGYRRPRSGRMLRRLRRIFKRK